MTLILAETAWSSAGPWAAPSRESGGRFPRGADLQPALDRSLMAFAVSSLYVRRSP